MNMNFIRKVSVVFLVVATVMQVGLATATELQYNLSANGGINISYNGSKIFKTVTPYWGANWKYASVSLNPVANSAHHWQGDASGGLTFSLDTKWSVDKNNLMTGVFTFDVPETIDPAIGGGLEFQLSLKEFKNHYGASDPILFGDGSGWEWKIADGKTVRMTFLPKLPSIYFERGNKNKLRCMFFSKSVPAGKHSFTMKVELPEGSIYKKSDVERYGNADKSNWIKDALNPTKSFVDLSSLNHKPAGKYGMVKTVGDQFVLGNGKPIRFWGANVQAYSLFVKDRNLIKAHAKRLAALGFNLIRLHHMDSTWVNPSLVNDGPTSQELNPDALDTYFYWIKCLKDEGIYIWVDLHVGRPVRRGDTVPGFDELERKARNKKAGPEVKGYSYVNDRITELMQLFNEKLLTTVNPYTGIALKDDKSIMTFMLTNENDLSHHFGNSLLGDKNVPEHHKLFKAEVQAFADKTGLKVNDLQKTWEPGISKIMLNDMEHSWNMKMIAHLRKIGVKQPIDTCQMWGGTPLYSLPALTAGDMIDTHTYYHGHGLTSSPRGGGGAVNFIARSQVAGMPLTITEWNNEDAKQITDTFVFPIMIGTMAAFQGWDAPMLYGYSQDAMRQGRISDWSSHNIPTTMGVMPALAMLYRQKHVRQAEETYVAQLSRETLFMQGHSEAEPAFSTLSMMHRIVVALPETKELPWLKAYKLPAGVIKFTDLREDFIPAGQNYVESDTGELRRDWDKGILTINTKKTQAAVGWIKGEDIQLDDIAIKIDNPKAAVIVTSLDNNPISTSGRMLITAVGRLDRSQRLTEPISGTIRFSCKAAAMTLIPLEGDGSEKRPITVKKESGLFIIRLDPQSQTHWYILKSM